MAEGTRLLVPAALAAALAAWGGPPAEARSPSAADQGSMDWILQRLQRDREDDLRAPVKVDPIEAYATGAVPLEDFKALKEIIEDPRQKLALRDRATTALLKRFQLEDERKTVEARALEAARNSVCRDLLRLMLAEDQGSRNCVHRVTSALLRDAGVKWDPNDSLAKRKKAYDDIKKRLK